MLLCFLKAVHHLNDFAEYCKSILLNKGRLTIDGLGFFYSDLENNICFEPQQQINFLTSSFGLSPVSVKEIEVETLPQTETVFIDRVITNTSAKTEKIKSRNYRRIAIAAISGVFFLSGLLLVVSNSKISGQLKASLLGKEQKLIYTPISYQELDLKNLDTEKKDYVADVNGIAVLELENNKSLTVRAIENSLTEPEVAKTNHVTASHISKKNFEIVLGCFSILNNANRMVKKLRSENVSANLSGQNNKGLYVVSSGNFETKEEALVQLSALKNVSPNAWIKKGE